MRRAGEGQAGGQRSQVMAPSPASDRPEQPGQAEPREPGGWEGVVALLVRGLRDNRQDFILDIMESVTEV